jgi:hypothetical protein
MLVHRGLRAGYQGAFHPHCGRCVDVGWLLPRRPLAACQEVYSAVVGAGFYGHDANPVVLA